MAQVAGSVNQKPAPTTKVDPNWKFPTQERAKLGGSGSIPGQMPSVPTSSQPSVPSAGNQNAAWAAQDAAATAAKRPINTGINTGVVSGTPQLPPAPGSALNPYAPQPAGGAGSAAPMPIPMGGGGGASAGGGVAPSLEGLQSAASSGVAGPGEIDPSVGMLEAPGALRQGIGNRIMPEMSQALAGLRRVY